MGSKITYDFSKLRGKVKEKLGSQALFAMKIGWSERTASLKLNGKKEWKQREIVKACKVLSIPEREISTYFFTVKVQN